MPTRRCSQTPAGADPWRVHSLVVRFVLSSWRAIWKFLFLFLPVDTFHRTLVDRFALNFIFAGAGTIEGFSFALIVVLEHFGKIVYTQPATDTLFLVNPYCFRHSFCLPVLV